MLVVTNSGLNFAEFRKPAQAKTATSVFEMSNPEIKDSRIKTPKSCDEEPPTVAINST